MGTLKEFLVKKKNDNDLDQQTKWPVSLKQWVDTLDEKESGTNYLALNFLKMQGTTNFSTKELASALPLPSLGTKLK